jgi:hypothetical protein
LKGYKMADGNIKRIHSKGEFEQEEYYAGEAGIYPGMQLELNSAGKVIKHATSGGALGDEAMYAMEDQMQGKTVDDVYTINTIVTCIIPRKGSEINVLLADGETVAIGTKIMSGGDGTSKANSGGVKIMGEATAALDLSASANTANALTPMRVS